MPSLESSIRIFETTVLAVTHTKAEAANPRLQAMISSEFAVGWGTLALINAGLAQGKNRSGLAWFLLSVLLGPIATFLLLLVDKLPGPKS